MKKVILIIFTITLFLLLTEEKYVVIPEEAIRLRVISSSNDYKDIDVKLKLSDALIKIFDGDKNVNKELDEVDRVIKKVFKENDYDKSYTINYGDNYFPKKVFNEVIYPSGNYESLVITIGEGEGNNFWCVLFPPLCNLENTSGTDDVEYKFKVSEIINKLMNNI